MQQTPDLPDYEFPETSGKNSFAYMYEKKRFDERLAQKKD